MLLYSGPYSGRSPDIIPKLRGVMTNPNCEYGANFVAIHSLAAWSRCTVDGCETLSTNDTVTSDIKLELGSPGELVPPPPSNLPSHVYHPRHALRAAVSQWLPEFFKIKPMWGPITKPQVGLNPVGVLQPSVNTCLTTTSTTSSINTPLPMSTISNMGTTGPPSPKPEPDPLQNPVESAHAQNLPQLPLVTPLVPVMNSLVSHNIVVMERSVAENSDQVKSGGGGPEPMEVMAVGQDVGVDTMDSTTCPPSPPTPEPSNGLTKTESTTMLCDDSQPCINNNLLNVEERNEKRIFGKFKYEYYWIYIILDL